MITAKQLFKIHILNLIHDGVTGNQLADFGDGPDPDRQTDQRVNNGTTALVRGRRDRQQDLPDRKLLYQVGQLIRSQDRTTIDHCLVQIGVVVDKCHNAVIRAVIEGIKQLTT